MEGFWRLIVRTAIALTIATSMAACASGTAPGSPAAGSQAAASVPGPSSVPSASTGISQKGAHTTAIKACDVLNESTMSQLAGFAAKFFGSGDPLARVPFTDSAFVNANGAALRMTACGYWESGVTGELSRDVSVTVMQGDPAKPGSWSPDAAHGQYTIMQGRAPVQPQAVSGLGDEGYGTTSNGQISLTVRSDDVIVRVEADSPPGTTVLTLDLVKRIAAAVLARL